MKLIASPLVSMPSGTRQEVRQSVAANDSQRYSPCLSSIFKRCSPSVCQVKRVLHQMKPALVEARYTYPLFISGPGAVQR